MAPTNQITFTPATGVATQTSKSLSNLYSASDAWIKNNTNADIEYLTRIVVATPANTQASKELDITLPSTLIDLSHLTDNTVDATEDSKIIDKN